MFGIHKLLFQVCLQRVQKLSLLSHPSLHCSPSHMLFFVLHLAQKGDHVGHEGNLNSPGLYVFNEVSKSLVPEA